MTTPTEEPKNGLLKKLARPLVAGLLALFPLVLTVAVVVWFGTTIHELLGPDSGFGRILRRFGFTFVTGPVVAYLIGLAATLSLIYGLGLLVEAGMKNRWQAFTDLLLTRVPLISTVYDAGKRIARMIEPKEKSEIRSMTAVLCSFGGENGTVFPAFMPTAEPLLLNGQEFRVVMIPTAPVPFGGAIMCVPAAWITPMPCGIEGLLNIYMTMGVAAPEYLGQKGPAPARPLP